MIFPPQFKPTLYGQSILETFQSNFRTDRSAETAWEKELRAKCNLIQPTIRRLPHNARLKHTHLSFWSLVDPLHFKTRRSLTNEQMKSLIAVTSGNTSFINLRLHNWYALIEIDCCLRKISSECEGMCVSLCMLGGRWRWWGLMPSVQCDE